MELRPILSTLRRHKTAAALIVLEIALSTAIICNALFLIGNRIERMDRVSGQAESELLVIRISGIAENKDAAAITLNDLQVLRALPGVRNASSTNQVTFGGSSWNSGVRLIKDQQQENLNATTYLGGQQLFDTMGLKLIAGRQFTADEFVDWAEFDKPNSKVSIPSTIITKVMADKLFPGENAVGKSFYSWGEEPIRVVGVVEHLVRPNEQGGPTANEYSMMFPINLPYEMGGNYLIRVTDPSRRQEVMQAAMKALESSGPTRIISEEDSKTFEQLRDEYYRQDKAMAWLLVAVCVALLVVTALGIVGLASFWVQQRTRQIGVRRALGATKMQILRYFQVENFLLASLGIVIGMLLAYAINQMLMGKYELPRLPLYYLPIGAVALWLLGQVSVLGPALKAAAVPPAIATRSV
ncbi:putative ABC transport system permease protein [Luteimonas cucumeris]|uniref:Putative ABC transport system permease protein n=1 Tax=Luteimonas cucumeris TaxID=985012 RepID=A0A562LEH9_9GAMM|nr:FtsX-like permease family protein [Luteimonas cucumeris]TWI06043.1 putative ABC transport system permease protein [Luteimonas cucumeris]